MIRYFFVVRDLHPLLHAGFSGAHKVIVANHTLPGHDKCH